MTIVTLVALALLIAFNAVFIAQPSTCILTTSCLNNTANQPNNTGTMRQSFFSTFNSLNGFRNYTEAQSKLLFQALELSLGCLCFVLNVAHLVIYIFLIFHCECSCCIRNTKCVLKPFCIQCFFNDFADFSSAV